MEPFILAARKTLFSFEFVHYWRFVGLLLSVSDTVRDGNNASAKVCSP